MFFDFIEQALRGRVNRYMELKAGGVFDQLSIDVQREVSREVHMAHELDRAQLYFLEVDQADALRNLELTDGAFPHLPHPLTWVEFDGVLHYDYDHIHCIATGKQVENFEIPGGSNYRGVFLAESDELVNASWLGLISPVELEAQPNDIIRSTFMTFSVSIRKSEFPAKSYERTTLESLVDAPVRKDQIEKEIEHCKRLYQSTINLIYFLTAENQTYVKIKPEHRQTYGAELKELPRCKQPYRIVSFQASRLRYEQRSAPTGRHIGVRHDVRGHFRHLRDERYSRDEAGGVRTVWVQAHQRGLLADVYRPKLRVGHVGARLLDYDEFRRETEARKGAA